MAGEMESAIIASIVVPGVVLVVFWEPIRDFVNQTYDHFSQSSYKNKISILRLRLVEWEATNNIKSSLPPDDPAYANLTIGERSMLFTTREQLRQLEAGEI